MDDIAERLHISKNSVSLALGNKKGVSDDLRKRIFETAEEMGYAANSAKNTLITGCIAILVPAYLHGDSFSYSDIFWTIDKAIRERKLLTISFIVSKTMEEDLLLPDFPPEMHVTGMVVVGVLNKKYLARLRRYGVPVVATDLPHNESEIGYISSGNINGAYAATEYLISQGHRDIGFVGPIYFSKVVFERYCGYRNAMMANALYVNPSGNILGDNKLPRMIDSATDLEPYIQNIREMPTAWCCAGDRVAFSLMNLLLSRGIRIPHEVSVIGFDDIPLATMVLPQLSTVRTDREMLGQVIVEHLLTPLYNENALSVQIPTRLVVRDSIRSIL